MNAFLSRVTLASLMLGASMLATAADGIPRSAPPADAKVFIVSPKDGATVDKTFTVTFGMEGLKLAPAEADLMFFVDKPYYDIFIDIFIVKQCKIIANIIPSFFLIILIINR